MEHCFGIGNCLMRTRMDACLNCLRKICFAYKADDLGIVGKECDLE